jgi:hypothetical protein
MAARYQRIYYLLGEDDRGTRRTYDCNHFGQRARDASRSLRGPCNVTRVTETCTRPQGSITNEFWIEGASVRQSRQWTSGGIGFIDFERVID